MNTRTIRRVIIYIMLYTKRKVNIDSLTHYFKNCTTTVNDDIQELIKILADKKLLNYGIHTQYIDKNKYGYYVLLDINSSLDKNYEYPQLERVIILYRLLMVNQMININTYLKLFKNSKSSYDRDMKILDEALYRANELKVENLELHYNRKKKTYELIRLNTKVNDYEY